MQNITTKNGTKLTIDPLTAKVGASSNIKLIGTNIYNLFNNGKTAKVVLSNALSETVAELEVKPEDAAMINICHAWALAELKM